MRDRESRSVSVSTAGLVLASAVLVAAKIWGGLAWPWWVVTLPLWIAVALAAVALALIAIIGLVVVLALLFAKAR